MTANDFKNFWGSRYPETVPISHYFKHVYSDRWFRVHSLPQSKRYANNEQEWSIILQMQNQIITDLIGENSYFLLVTGEHWMKGYTELHPIAEVASIKQIPFILLDKIDLNKFIPDEYEIGMFYRPMFSEQIWVPQKFDNLLRDISDDNLRAFFISIENELIIVPYDGGIDFIVKNKAMKEVYTRKYASLLSVRQDGL